MAKRIVRESRQQSFITATLQRVSGTLGIPRSVCFQVPVRSWGWVFYCSEGYCRVV